MSNHLRTAALATVTAEEAHAEFVEINFENEGGDRFLSEWDLAQDEDRTAEADFDEWAEREREWTFNRI